MADPPDSCIAVGIDPGFAKVGFGLVELTPWGTRVLDLGTWRTAKGPSDDERMGRIGVQMLEYFAMKKPDVVAYESQIGVQIGVNRDEPEKVNKYTPRLHQCCGMVMLASLASHRARPVYAVASSTMRVAVLGKGRGRASKEQLQAGVRLIVGPNRRFSKDASEATAAAVVAGRKWLHEQRIEHAQQKELFG